MRLSFFGMRQKPVDGDAEIFISGARRSEGGRARSRVLIAMLCFTGIYGTIGARLAYYGMQEPGTADARTAAVSAARPDLVDRNGDTLATDIKTADRLHYMERAALLSLSVPELRAAARSWTVADAAWVDLLSQARNPRGRLPPVATLDGRPPAATDIVPRPGPTSRTF